MLIIEGSGHLFSQFLLVPYIIQMQPDGITFCLNTASDKKLDEFNCFNLIFYFLLSKITCATSQQPVFTKHINATHKFTCAAYENDSQALVVVFELIVHARKYIFVNSSIKSRNRHYYKFTNDIHLICMLFRGTLIVQKQCILVQYIQSCSQKKLCDSSDSVVVIYITNL